MPSVSSSLNGCKVVLVHGADVGAAYVLGEALGGALPVTPALGYQRC